MIIKGIVLALFCSFSSLIIHLVISLYRRGRMENEPIIFELGRQMKLLIIIWLVFFIFYSFFYFSPLIDIHNINNQWNIPVSVASFIYGVILYLFFCFLYLTFYYFINRSVSATILEIFEKGQLTTDELKYVYDVEKKYQNELDGMLQGGFLIKDSDYYRCSLKGKIFAKIARFTKRYLKLGPGG